MRWFSDTYFFFLPYALFQAGFKVQQSASFILL